MWELIRAWRARPELRARFVTEGVVRARALLLWGFTLGPDDPSFAALRPVAASLERWYRDLPVGARRAGV